jgi:hypothetical protein
MRFKALSSLLLLFSLIFFIGINVEAATSTTTAKAEKAVKSAETSAKKIKPIVTASSVKSLHKLDSKLQSSFASSINNAKKEVAKLTVSSKKKYQKRLQSLDSLYSKTKTYSTVYSEGEKVSSKQLSFLKALTKNPESTQTYQYYNDLSKERSTFVSATNNIKDKMTKTAFLNKFNLPAYDLLVKQKPTMAANLEYTKLKKDVLGKIKESDFLKQESTTVKAISKITDKKINSRFLTLNQSLYYQYYPERKSIDSYMSALNSTVKGKNLQKLDTYFDVDSSSKTVMDGFFKTLFANKQWSVKNLSYSYMTSTKIKWLISYGNSKSITLTLLLSEQAANRKITDVELPINMAGYLDQSISTDDQKKIQYLFKKIVDTYNQRDYDGYTAQLSLIDPAKHETDLLNLYNDLNNQSLSQRMDSYHLVSITKGIVTVYSNSVYGEDEGFEGLKESTQWKLKKISNSWKIIDYTALDLGSADDLNIIGIN